MTGLKRLDGGVKARMGGGIGCAREVSDEWVVEEEELAQGIEESPKKRDREKEKRVAIRDRLRELGLRSDRPKGHDKLVEAALERKWAIEDYGESLDVNKLLSLDKALRPSWMKWYAQRIAAPRVVIPSNATSTKVARLDKHDKIALDNKRVRELEVIPDREMTLEEKAEYKLISNRKLARERYRLKKLLGEGLTQEDIDIAGGVDGIYASRAGREYDKIDLESLGAKAATSEVEQDDQAIEVLHSIPERLRSKEQKRLLRKLKRNRSTRDYRKRVKPEDEEERLGTLDEFGEVSLKEIEVDKYLAEKRWDVFNYSQLAHLQ
jgi:hypothetical protein